MMFWHTALPSSSLGSPKSQIPSHIWRQSMWHDKHLHCYQHPEPRDNSKVKINKSLRNERFQNSYISANNHTPSHMEVQMKRGTTSPPLHDSPPPGNILYKRKKLSLHYFNRPRFQTYIESSNVSNWSKSCYWTNNDRLFLRKWMCRDIMQDNWAFYLEDKITIRNLDYDKVQMAGSKVTWWLSRGSGWEDQGSVLDLNLRLGAAALRFLSWYGRGLSLRW